MTAVANPFPLFTDNQGRLIDNGRVFVGLPDLDPETNPALVYWDEALTIAAAQPLQTVAGYVVNGGSPSRFFVKGNYSIRVRQPNGAVVFYESRALAGSDTVGVTLAELKAADTSGISFIYDGSIWVWTLGDYTGRADDALVVQSDSAPITEGAWVREGIDDGIPAEVFGISTSNSAAVNTPLFHRMWDYAAGRLTLIGNGRYRYAGSYAGPVNMQGQRLPSLTPDRTAWENGSIFEGSATLSGSTVVLRDMAIDHGAAAFATGGDALKISAASYNSGRLVILQNVGGLGRSDSDPFHSILIEGYSSVSLLNVHGHRNGFGIGIKSRNVTLQGFTCSGGTGLIIKSDKPGGADPTAPGSGSAGNVNVSDGNINGSADQQIALRVLADNESMANLNISNINGDGGCDVGIVLEVAASSALSNVNFSQVNIKGARQFGVKTGGAGALYEAQFDGFNLVELEAYAAQFQKGSIKLRNFYGSLKAGATTHAADMMRAEASMADLSIDSMTLVENYGAGAAKPALYLGLNPLLTQLSGERRYLVEGNVPEPGLNAQSPTGSSASLTLLPDLNGGRSTCIVTLSGPTTVTSINQVMPGTTTNYPRGYLVTILNASASALTLQNNGNIRPRAGADLVVSINQTATFAWLGSSWHQVS